MADTGCSDELSGVDERGFSLKPTRCSQTALSFAPDKRPKNIFGPEEGHLRWTEVTHTYVQRALSGLQVQRNLISAEILTTADSVRCLLLMEDYQMRGHSRPMAFRGLSEDHFLQRLMQIKVILKPERKII